MLDYPNEEVRASFAGSLVERYLGVGVECRQSLAVRLVDALFRGDAGGAVESLRPFFASIPYDLTARNDNYYQTAVHLVFTMLGLRCRSGVRIAGGRIDTVVETGDYLYCFEFKLGGEGKRVTAEEALRQIESREYLLPWRGLCGRQEAGKGRGGV
jgi:hypothetical protein